LSQQQQMKFDRSSGLYVIVDCGVLGERDPLEFAQTIMRSAPLFALQLRAKELADSPLLALACELRALCDRAGVCFVLNDRPDLAVLASAHGVHVGQHDLSVSEVRSIAPGLLVGCSTHTLTQLEAALDQRPDYVALGPIFSTRSKLNPDPVVGLEMLTTAVQLCREREIPLVAIGGITAQNATLVRQAAVTASAVIGELAQWASDTTLLAMHTASLARALTR
jgi:thiamine-phosphate pyrophosphorylase